MRPADRAARAGQLKMDEGAVHGRRLLQSPQVLPEVLRKRFGGGAAAASMWLLRCVLGGQCGPVPWVCGAADDAAGAFCPLHWGHYIVVVLQPHLADVTEARVLEELVEFRVPQRGLAELRL